MKTPISVVDSHLHFWDLERFVYPWLAGPGLDHLHSNYLPADWKADAQDVDIKATVHVQAEVDHESDPVSETAWLESLQQLHTEAIPTVCVGYADLRSPDLEETLDRHQQHSLFRGVRQEAWFDPQSTRADIPKENLLDDPAWIAGLRSLERRGLTFDLLVWASQLEAAAAIFREMPDLSVVLEHTGVPIEPEDEAREIWRRGMHVFAETVPHSLLKLSALGFVSSSWNLSELKPIVREAIEIFGPDRCMFGSNFPVERHAITYAELWAAYSDFASDLTASERSQVFGETAGRVYRIDTK